MPNSGLQNIYIMYGDSIPNYFNRRILFYGSLEDYLTAAGDNYELHEEVNFNPADGVNTYLDVVTDMGDKFSYLLLVDPEDGTILSRWFILEADRNLGGQYRFTLRRDVVAESISNNNFATTSPVYVEKGILNNEDPMIVNKEGLEFNRIKIGESLLYHYKSNPYLKLGCVVGYYEKGSSVSSFTIQTGITPPDDYVTANDIATATGIDLTTVNSLLSGGTVTFASSDLFLSYGILIYASNNLSSLRGMKISIKNKQLNSSSVVENNLAFSYNERIGTLNTSSIPATSGIADYISSSTESAVLTAINDVIDNDNPSDVLLTLNQYEALKKFNGRVVLKGGDYFTLSIESGNESNHEEVVISQHENTFFDNAVLNAVTTEKNDWKLYLNYKIIDVSANLDLLPTAQSLNVKISSSGISLHDAPYSMFVIPFTDDGNTPYYYGYYDNNTQQDVTSISYIGKQEAIRIGTEIGIKLGTKLYDIQMLPYLPDCSNILRKKTDVDIDYIDVLSGTESTDFEYIKDNNNVEKGIIIYSKISNFSFYIPKTIESQDSPKIESQCNFYRLCSPNYNGVFEFNLAKNAQSVVGFYGDCTYKPVSPLIRIQPAFKGLYGTNFIDGRGLICGGDFSLPIISDAWINYQNNNKNFAASFARDIENLDFNLKQEAFKESIGLGTGIVGGAGAGATMGGKLGGGYGAAAGAIIGGSVGAVGAAIDTKLGTDRRAEMKDYAIDRFNLNLANIKAIPQTLTRNSSFTIINKLVPFVESYSCTDKEKEALRRKIDLDGMTVGRIDYIGNFMSLNYDGNKYFKGQLIRAEGLEEDTHYINALYDEIAKGVYI